MSERRLIPWYKPETYDEVRRLLSDGAEKMPATYAEWLASAEAEEREMKAAGVATHRICHIEPDALWAWCRFTKSPLTYRALAEYARDQFEVAAAKVRQRAPNN